MLCPIGASDDDPTATPSNCS